MQNSLQRDGSVPLHTQITEALRMQIKTGEIKPGENFPSERELADIFGVSRMTVRQAVQTLRQEDLIYHERGVGTFVSSRKIDVHTRNLGGFSDEMRAIGLKPSSRLVKLERENAGEQVASDLDLTTTETVFHIERLRLAGDEPMAFEVTYLPEKICPRLDDWDLSENSLYRILVGEYGLQMSRAAEILEAAAATKFIAAQLGIKKGAPVLVVHRVVFSESNQPIESAHTTYRADRYRATFYLSRNNR